MPPPNAITCQLCGGKFFKHSIDKHLKVCRERVGIQLHPCPYCNVGVTMLEMDAHVLKCSAAKAAGAKPTGQSKLLDARLKRDNHRNASSRASKAFLAAGRQDDFGEIIVPPDELGDLDDVRAKCRFCGRKFNFDRIAKHQSICQKIAEKKPRGEFHVTRIDIEGGSDANVIGVSRSAPAKSPRGQKPKVAGLKGVVKDSAHAQMPDQSHTNWRAQSAAFREAMRAARGLTSCTSAMFDGSAEAKPPTTSFGTKGYSQGRVDAESEWESTVKAEDVQRAKDDTHGDRQSLDFATSEASLFSDSPTSQCYPADKVKPTVSAVSRVPKTVAHPAQPKHTTFGPTPSPPRSTKLLFISPGKASNAAPILPRSFGKFPPSPKPNPGRSPAPRGSKAKAVARDANRPRSRSSFSSPNRGGASSPTPKIKTGSDSRPQSPTPRNGMPPTRDHLDLNRLKLDLESNPA